MNTHRIFLLGAFAALTSVTSTLADTDPGGRSFVAPVGDGTLTSSASSARSGAEIHAGSENTKAYIRLGRSLSESSFFSVFSLTASAPLDKKSDTTSLATLDGFANAFTLELKLTRFITHRKSVNWSEHLDYYNRLQEAVAKGALAKGDVKTLEDGIKTKQVDSGNLFEYAPEMAAGFESFTRDRDKWDKTGGIAASVGHQAFSFLTPPVLTKESTDKIPWSVKAFYGFMPGSDDTLVTFSYEYQDAYKDADSKTIVLPPDTSGVQEAKTGAIGPPKRDRKQLVALEVRRFFTLTKAEKPIGLNLKLTYDLEEDTFGAEMPVWLVRDAKGNLTGGLSFGWKEKDHRFTVGVIVGGAFGFF